MICFFTGDSRFDFLRKNHLYYPYYQCKLQLYAEVYGDSFKKKGKVRILNLVLIGSSKVLFLLQDSNSYSSKRKVNLSSYKKDYSGSGRSISFSIRSRDHDQSVTSHTSFPVESSTSDENEDIDDEEREKRRAEREKRRVARREKERREREDFLRKERERKEKEDEDRRKKRLEGESSGNEDLYDIFKYGKLILTIASIKSLIS